MSGFIHKEIKMYNVYPRCVCGGKYRVDPKEFSQMVDVSPQLSIRQYKHFCDGCKSEAFFDKSYPVLESKEV